MKTLAIRLEDDVHAVLSVIAQLEGTTVTDTIRQAIEAYVSDKRTNGNLASKASQVLDDIEREASARRDAIQSLFGEAPPESAQPTATEPSRPRGRRGSGTQEPTA